MPGETLSGIAFTHGTTYQVLASMNGIENPNLIRPGQVLRLPGNATEKPIPDEAFYGIELLPQARQMHVSKPGGAEKWLFGNVKKWSDFQSAGHVDENTNVDIVAIAHLPLPPNGAAYFMDQAALGSEYEKTGRVATTVGFSWADMADGFVEPPKPEPILESQPTLEPVPEKVADPVAPAVVAQDVTPVLPDTTNAYKSSYTGYIEPTMYMAKRTLMVKEFDGRRPDRELYENQNIEIAGTFIRKEVVEGKPDPQNVLYGRPKKAADAGYWFGIPMDALQLEDDLYNMKLELPEKIALHKRLTSHEYVIMVLAKIQAFVTQVAMILKNTKRR
jgi:hypothetical protein